MEHTNQTTIIRTICVIVLFLAAVAAFANWPSKTPLEQYQSNYRLCLNWVHNAEEVETACNKIKMNP